MEAIGSKVLRQRTTLQELMTPKDHEGPLQKLVTTIKRYLSDMMRSCQLMPLTLCSQYTWMPSSRCSRVHRCEITKSMSAKVRALKINLLKHFVSYHLHLS